MTERRLGINIDHVATLRQARGEFYPMPDLAAKISLESGADQITMHLREDRRHIQDADVSLIKNVTDKFNKPLNFEMGCHPDIVAIAIAHEPEWICLVPENRQERTTEGGLDLISENNFSRVKDVISEIRKQSPNTAISLFVEGNIDTLKKSVDLKVDACEIHTGDYAKHFLDEKDCQSFYKEFSFAQEYLNENNIGAHAGHGLTNKSLLPLVEQNLFIEYNIGHWVIAESIFSGLSNVVKELKQICSKES